MSEGRASPAAAAASVEAIFRRAGAYRDGHFLLKSGRHGDAYIEKFEVLQWPELVAELCQLLVGQAVQAGADEVDVVIGPTTGGVILAYECARQLGTRGIFAEEVTDSAGQRRRELRRGFAVAAGERVLLVDDVVTTGGSLLEMLAPIEAAGGELVLASVLVDRSGGLAELVSPASGRRYPVEALWSLALPTYEAGPASCPGCALGIPLVAPGSTGTKGAPPA
jgi:orotate phosphoribosyltransferase